MKQQLAKAKVEQEAAQNKYQILVSAMSMLLQLGNRDGAAAFK